MDGYRDDTYYPTPAKDGVTLWHVAVTCGLLSVLYHICKGIYISWISWEWFPPQKLGFITFLICGFVGIISAILLVVGMCWLFSTDGAGQIQIIKPRKQSPNLNKQYEEIGRMLVNGNEQGADELLDKLNKNKIKIPK